MRTLIATIAAGCLLCVSGAARAEKQHGRGFLKHDISIGLDTDVGIPLGNYADANSVGGGVLVNAEYQLLEMLGATMRVGFEAHMNRSVGNTDMHVHAIPILFGTKYYMTNNHQGLFGSFELGLFDLMSSVTVPVRGVPTTTSSNDIKFGMGAGLGFQQDRWNARVNIHTQDLGNFSDAVIVTAGIGYQFGTF
jgi:hypothetical protein